MHNRKNITTTSLEINSSITKRLIILEEVSFCLYLQNTRASFHGEPFCSAKVWYTCPPRFLDLPSYQFLANEIAWLHVEQEGVVEL